MSATVCGCSLTRKLARVRGSTSSSASRVRRAFDDGELTENGLGALFAQGRENEVAALRMTEDQRFFFGRSPCRKPRAPALTTGIGTLLIDAHGASRGA